MDSKGLVECNSLERDKACWRCCCPDGRKAACGHDGLDSLAVGLRTLLAPAQFIATKQGEEAQTRPAENLAAYAIMSKGHWDNTPLKHSATPLFDNTDSSFCSPSRSVYAGLYFTKHHWHHNLGYPSFDDLSQSILGYPKIKQKQMGYHGITRRVTYPWISQDKYVCTDVSQLLAFLRWKSEQLVWFSQVKPQYPISHKISEGYPWIGHMSGYPRISYTKLGYACLKCDIPV